MPTSRGKNRRLAQGEQARFHPLTPDTPGTGSAVPGGKARQPVILSPRSDPDQSGVFSSGIGNVLVALPLGAGDGKA